MADASIEFKGTSFTLSVLHLKTSVLDNIRADLTKKIAQAPDFFYLVPVVISVEKLVGIVDYQAIKSLVEEFNFTFVGFTGEVLKESRTLIRDLGFSFINTTKVSSPKTSSTQDTSTEGLTTQSQGKSEQTPKASPKTTSSIAPVRALFTDKIHRGQIRSGQQVYAKGQNLVIIGSVSAGAEVIADGNIHVYGSLRGRAIAGATGHQHAQIYCQKLEAELVSINGNYWLSESMEQDWGNPAYIHLTDTELTSSKLI